MEKTLYTPIALKRERCPRIISGDEREEKAEAIRKLTSDKSFSLLMSMAKEYESKQG